VAGKWRPHTVVDRSFEWLRSVLRERIFVPSSPFVQAAGYAIEDFE